MVAPKLEAPAAPAPAIAPDAFPSLVQPRSYLPPELGPNREHEPVPEHPHQQEHRHERLDDPLVEPAPPMPVATRRARGGRPILVGAGALAVVVAAFLFLTSTRSSSQVAAESTPPAEQSKPAPAPADEDEHLPPEDTDLPVPPPAAMKTAPARSGPPSQAWSSSAGATAPLLPTGPARQPDADAPDAIVAAPSIAPPPANVELAVPKLPASDSLAPKAQRDTAAIKRILKAVGGQ
jgi:hypothetical protein